MASHHNLTLLANLNKGIVDLGAKLNSFEERLNTLQPTTSRAAPSWVDKSMLDNAVSEVDASVKAIDTATRSLASDFRQGIAQVKDEVAKERAAAENAMLLKLEHFVAKCVKERLELAMQGVKQNVDDRIKEKIEEAIADLKMFTSKSIEGAVTSVKSQVPQVQAPSQAPSHPPPQTAIDTSSMSLDIESLTKSAASVDPTGDTVTFGSDHGSDIQIKKRGFKKVAKQ